MASSKQSSSPAPAAVVVPLWAKMIAGGIAGIIGTSIVFPMDLIKTRLQNQGVGGAPLRYSGPVDCFKKIVAAEGAAGMYNGLRPNLLGVFPEKALKLSVNDTFRERFTRANGDGKIKIWQSIASGGAAGFLQVAVTNPMEIVKLRMQLQGEAGVAKSTGATVAELGLRGLYRGVTACWLRDVPFSFVFFPLYAALNSLFRGDESVAGTFTAGAMAGSLAAGAVTPADVVKTRLQVKGGAAKYKGIADCIAVTYREEGLRAFQKGLVPRMLVQAPLFGCTLLSYEVLKAIYRKRDGRAHELHLQEARR